MTKWLSCSAILIFELLVAAPANACDTAATATKASMCVVMSRDGVRGVWYELKTANELRETRDKFKLEVPELKLQIRLGDRRNSVRDFQLESYREVVAIKDGSIKLAQDSMVAFARTAREAREAEREAVEELNAWYRSQVLWMGIGASVVTIIVVSLSAASIGK